MFKLAELLALPAGRELDCAVAELLGEKPPRGWRFNAERHEWVLLFEAWPSYYSIDIAAAWPLMAEMLEQTEAPMELWFMAGIGLDVGMDDRHLASVPSLTAAPLAIVRAWLTWKLSDGSV